MDIAASVNAIHRQTVDDAKILQRNVLIVGIVGAIFIGGLGFRIVQPMGNELVTGIEQVVIRSLQQKAPFNPASLGWYPTLDMVLRVAAVLFLPSWIVAQICALYVWLAKRLHMIRTAMPVSPIGPGERALFQVVLGQSLSNANIWVDVEINKRGQLDYKLSVFAVTLAIAALAFVVLFIRTAIWG